MSDQALNIFRTGPAQYANCTGILEHAGELIAAWGRRALICGGRNALNAAEEPLVKSLARGEISWGEHRFTGECSPENIGKVKARAQELNADLMIGVGGGKSLDTAKAAAAEMGIPVVCIPTIAATCAASTALSVTYNEDGTFRKSIILPRNPCLVLVDPLMIANAPEEYMRAGVMDSIAKWYEGRAIVPGIANPDIHTLEAISLAEVLYNGLRRHALKAVTSVMQRSVDDSLIQTLDMVLLLTGVIQSIAKGTLFTAIAHCVHNGLTLIEESHALLHGIKVGYGIVVQCHVEKRPPAEFEDVVSFFGELGLTPSLKGLGLPYSPEIIANVAQRAANDPNLGPTTYAVNADVIASAMVDLERTFGQCSAG